LLNRVVLKESADGSAFRSLPVDLPTALLRDLLDLSSSVELHESEFGTRLAALVDALRAAVPSFRGMDLTLVVGDQPVNLAAFSPDETAEITTSLRLPFAALGTGFHRDSRVVFYAATPGAFVDLAADLGHALRTPFVFDGVRPPIAERLDGESLDGHDRDGHDLDRHDRDGDRSDGHHRDGHHRDGQVSIVLDADLPPRTSVSGLTGLDDGSVINRAIGMLIDQGHHPDEAHATLYRHAAAAGVEPHIYAAQLLRR
jgi:hypothetical protein